VAAGQKYVRYWAMASRNGAFEPNSEVDELEWLPAGKALRKLSYPHDRQLVQRFTDALVATSTLLIVRHAKAGKKRRWQGEDSLRPLDSEGVAQAARLAAVAPCYGPSRIASADLLRCADTVRPLSHDLGLPIDIEPKLGRDAYAADPRATLAWVRDQVDQGGTAVLCSQGEVIPDLMTRLSAGSPLKMRRPAARKGSVWALSFAAGKLVGADYDADLLPPVAS
jgi:8-oxo-dGTP diphosphatase